MKMTPEQILQISKGDPEIAAFISLLLAENQRLENRIKELERQRDQNSSNSSKPPSSDGFRKPTNSRKPGGKQGAPKGHTGHTLELHAEPDEVIVQSLYHCPDCQTFLGDVAATGHIRRQVVDLPLPRLFVTEFQAEEKVCPCCHRRAHASFPVDVNAPIQYGESIAAWTAYLNVYQLLPLQRISQLFADLTGYRPSQATLLTQLKHMADRLQESTFPFIREQLRKQPVLHTDETGACLSGKRHWLHVVSDARWTWMKIFPKRGKGAIEAMGLLNTFQGIVVHDCLSAYFKPDYPFEHALCNAHLLRECQGIVDYDGHSWASQMKTLLVRAWDLTKTARASGVPLSDETIAEIDQEYDAILQLGKTQWVNDPIPDKTGPRGRKCKSKATNLGERLELHKDSILRFIRDARVPFDNNQAERDLRMSKIKQKISGSFRTDEGGETFATIRSFISSLLKQGLPLHSSLVSAFRGQFSFPTT